jgi:hypothetical protein
MRVFQAMRMSSSSSTQYQYQQHQLSGWVISQAKRRNIGSF